MTARERLKAWITNHTNQRRFADDIAITESYLSQVLAGLRTPRLPILCEIERQTGIPVNSWMPITNGKSAKARKAKSKSRSLGAEKSHVAVG